MTCIVGTVGPDRTVHMGADSRGVTVSTLDYLPRNDTKLFKKGEFLIGFCGSFRMGQLLCHSLPTLEQRPSQDVMSFLVNDFVNAVRDTYKQGGIKENEKGVDSQPGTFLLGYRGRLFQIESDFQVGEGIANYDAAGCGASYAVGSLHTTRNSKTLTPEKRLLRALQAATAHSAGVGGPFRFESLPYNGE